MKQRNKRIVLGSLLGVLILIIGFYLLAAWPRISAQRQTTAIAKKAGGLTSTTDFMIYRRNEVYYTVAGQNQDQELTYVMINGKTGKIRVLAANKGWSKAEIRSLVQKRYQPQKIYQINLGRHDHDPVWEVALKKQNGKLSYRLFDFHTGKVIDLIDNL